jgi:hypothetical protein
MCMKIGNCDSIFIFGDFRGLNICFNPYCQALISEDEDDDDDEDSKDEDICKHKSLRGMGTGRGSNESAASIHR